MATIHPGDEQAVLKELVRSTFESAGAFARELAYSVEEENQILLKGVRDIYQNYQLPLPGDAEILAHIRAAQEEYRPARV